MTATLSELPKGDRYMRTIRYIFLALTMMVSLMAFAGASGADETRDITQDLATHRASTERGSSDTRTTSSTRTTQATTSACSNEGRGDSVNGNTGYEEDFPKADLVTWCATYDNGVIGVSHKNAAPTDPRSDPNWIYGITGLLWDVDVNGDQAGDYGVYFFNDGSRLVAEVERYSDGRIVCSGQPGYDGSFYDVEFAASCVGSPAEIRVDAFVVYDSQWDDPYAPLYMDLADHFGGPVAPSGSTPPPSSGDEPQPAPNPSGDHFRDDNGNPHEANINFIYEQGLINGCGDGLFCPNEPLTRAQFATIMANYIRSQQ